MKSRLLPPPLIDHDEPNDAAPSLVQKRRESDFEPIESASPAAEPTPLPEPVEKPVATMPRSAPQVSARPSGRFAVVAILLTCMLAIGSLVWITFLRDEAFGIVSGRVTEISPPWSGTLSAVYAQIGDTVRQGDVLAIVYDPELRATVEQLDDELRAAQAELDSKAALLAIAARERSNHTDELRARYYDLRGELASEQSRYEKLSSKLQRRSVLAKQQAISDEEIESLRFEVQGLAAKIENLTLAVETLETRLDTTPASGSESDQLKPWLAKIEYLQAQTRRLREKLRRGSIRAPLSGRIIDVPAHVGEWITPQQSLVELLPEDTLRLVLYVKQTHASDYEIDQQLDVVVEPSAQAVSCRIVRIGERFEKPASHVPGRYRPDEKLLPIYLEPVAKPSDDLHLRIGSTVRLPFRWFDASK